MVQAHGAELCSLELVGQSLEDESPMSRPFTRKTRNAKI